MPIDVPKHLEHLPRTVGGLPVPHVAAWSSERWASARMDPVIGKRWALFTEGRQGRGKPILSSIHEERQRRSVMRNYCQVCNRQFSNEDLFVTTMAVHAIEQNDVRMAATYAPPTCRLCIEFSEIYCPAFKNPHGLIPFGSCLGILQLIDPSAAPMPMINRYDKGDNPAIRSRLGHISSRVGGLVGYVKLAIPPDLLDPALVSSEVSTTSPEQKVDQ